MRVRVEAAGLVATGIVVAIVATCIVNLPISSPVTGGDALALVKPVFAQQATAFPADEAGISAYVNVGQSIDLAKAKSAMRGIQAEGDNYVIGIMELPGLPEEEFPHMYISIDGWILAYYSKFAPASRIFQWYGYEGGPISTTTLQDAIATICPTIGVNFAQIKGNMGYYHFKYTEATKMVTAVERTERDVGTDTGTFNFSIPYDVTLYEGSWSHFLQSPFEGWTSYLAIDSVVVSQVFASPSLVGFNCEYFEDHQVTPGRLYSMLVDFPYNYEIGWAGVAVVFIYR